MPDFTAWKTDNYKFVGKAFDFAYADRLNKLSPIIGETNAKSIDYELTGSGGYADVTFSGSRQRGNTKTRNAEIAFVNEYGRQGQTARPFIRQAGEQYADEIAAPGERILGDWMEQTFAEG